MGTPTQNNRFGGFSDRYLAEEMSEGVFGYLRNEDNLRRIRERIKTREWISSMSDPDKILAMPDGAMKQLAVFANQKADSYFKAVGIEPSAEDRKTITSFVFLLAIVGAISAMEENVMITVEEEND